MASLKKRHYAWVICFACALQLFCIGGLCINAFGIYLPFIRVQNGFTNTQTSTLVTLRNLGCFGAMLLSGFYYKKVPLRAAIAIGSACCVTALVIYSMAKTYPVYCLAAVICGVGYAYSATVPTAMMLGRWFHKNRKLAIGLCTAATGLGVMGFPQIITWIIETYGLRTAFLLEAGTITAALIVVFLLLRNDPKDMGLQPYGEGEVDLHRPVERHGRKLEKRDWILLVPMIVMLGVINTCGYTQLTLLATNKGFASQTVASAISVTGIGLIVGKFTYGMISEKFGTVTCNWIYGSIVTLGLGLCCLANSGGILFAAFGLYALGLSIATVGLTTWPGELAAPEQHDRTVQNFQTISTAGALAFSSIPGILADLFDGSYVPAYIGFTAFALLALLAIQWIYYKANKEKPL